jgi:hypothetical protein
MNEKDRRPPGRERVPVVGIARRIRYALNGLRKNRISEISNT